MWTYMDVSMEKETERERELQSVGQQRGEKDGDFKNIKNIAYFIEKRIMQVQDGPDERKGNYFVYFGKLFDYINHFHIQMKKQLEQQIMMLI